MDSVLVPTNDTQVREAIAWALSEKKPMTVNGAGSKALLGRPSNSETTMDLHDFTGVIDYQPSELVLTARPGTPISEIDSLIREQNQELAFEPPDLGPLFGVSPGRATLGGIIACNLSGSRRVKVGAARDHFLGMQAINGRGEAFKSGGKVVKNVTGYDLCKLIAGSYGTLAVLTEISVKVLPKAEKTRTVLVFGLHDKNAIEMLSDIMSTVHEPTALAHLPPTIGTLSAVDLVANVGKSVTAVRVEGPSPSVISRCEKLRKYLSKFGKTEELHSQRSKIFWKEITNVSPFVGKPEVAVWRIGVSSTEAAKLTERIASVCEAEWFYDCAGGLIWLATPDTEIRASDAIREAVKSIGAQATLFRAEANLRAAVPVFEPLPEPLHNLSTRVKRSFDPQGILNPGRLYPGL